MNSNEQKMYDRAFQLKNEGKIEESISEFKRVLSEYPHSGISASMIANLYYSELNEPEKALPYGRLAIDLLPQNETASFCLSLCLFELNRKDEMYSEIKRYISEGGKLDLYNTLFEENDLSIDDFT